MLKSGGSGIQEVQKFHASWKQKLKDRKKVMKFFRKIPEGLNEPGVPVFLKKKRIFKGLRRSWERLGIGQVAAAILIALCSQPWRILISSLVVASIESFEFLM